MDSRNLSYYRPEFSYRSCAGSTLVGMKPFQTKWRAWLDDLPNLKLVSWPRCLKPKYFGVLHSIQLHHFSNASEMGYGAASYLRLVNDQGRVHCGLIMAKSRVAPLKTVTIPRMELTAAVVSVKLHRFITEQLDLSINKTVFWTDFTIVPQYI